MTEKYQPIAQLLDRVRVRWRRLVAFRAVRRAALLATVSLLAFSALASLTTRAPFALAAIGMLAVLLVGVAVVWGLLPLREAPSDARIARFIEERKADLDERLVSAVSVIGQNLKRVDTPAAKLQKALHRGAGFILALAGGR